VKLTLDNYAEKISDSVYRIDFVYGHYRIVKYLPNVKNITDAKSEGGFLSPKNNPKNNLWYDFYFKGNYRFIHQKENAEWYQILKEYHTWWNKKHEKIETIDYISPEQDYQEEEKGYA
jgi:hypothetical protein